MPTPTRPRRTQFARLPRRLGAVAAVAAVMRDRHGAHALQRGRQRPGRDQNEIGWTGVSQKTRTATVPKVFQIDLCGVGEADLELFCNSAGFLRERLYA